MKDKEVHQFKSKLESKRESFCSSNLLDSEWSSMIEKAKLYSNVGRNDSSVYARDSTLLSLFSSPKLSAALSFALVAVLLGSFMVSTSLFSRNQGRGISRPRRNVPAMNVSSRYI